MNKYDYKNWLEKHLPYIEVNIMEISEILSIDFNIINSYDIPKLQEIVFKLRKYSIYIKMLYNEEISMVNFFNSDLLIRAKPKANDYNSYDKDERFQLAILESDDLRKKQREMIDAKLKADRLYGLEKEINNFAYTIEKIIEKKERYNQ